MEDLTADTCCCRSRSGSDAGCRAGRAFTLKAVQTCQVRRFWGVLSKSDYIRRYIFRQKDRRVSGHYATNPHDFLVPERGVEPPTFALRMRCSTN